MRQCLYRFYLLIIKFKYAHEGFLRNLDRTYLSHSLLTFLLLLEELLLTRDIAAVALGSNVLAVSLDRLSCDDLAAPISRPSGVAKELRAMFCALNGAGV